MIFKQETLQSLFTGVSSSVNSQIIKPFANAEQVIWKYNQAIQHNSLTQKGWERLLAQSDDSMRAYLTSIKGSTASMTGYTTSLQGNITGFKKVSSAISQYNTLSAQGVAEQKTFATAVSTTNGKLGTYLSGLNGAKASMGGYVKSLITAKAASIGLKVATVALNASFSMGISLLVSKLISSITEYSERISTAAEKAGEALDTAKSNVKELNSLIKEYNDLQLSNEWDNTDIETKKQLQKDINALLDDEADKLDIINGKYEETTAELYKQKLAKLSEQEKSAYDALEAEKDALWDENKYTNLSFKYGYSNKDGVEYYEDLDVIEKYVKEYDDVLQAWKKTSLSASSSTSAFVGTDDPKNVEELITQYDRLKQLSQEMYDNGDTGAFYDSINSYLDELEERVKKIHGYETDFDNAQSANNLGKILTDPNNGFGGYIETLEEYQKVVDFINNSDYENKEGILEVLASDFYEFATQVENAGNTVDDFGNEITVLSGISETVDNLDKKVKPVMDSLKSAYQDIFTEDGFTLDNVGVDMLNSVKESIAEINEIEGIDIATSTFEDFAKVLTNTEITEEQAHKAFNDLVGDIINGTNSFNVSSEAVNVLVQSLEEMGVTNAKEVVDEMLSIKENLNKLSDEAESDVSKINSLLTGMGKEAVTSTNDLTECTWEEIEALMSASNTYGFTADKIKEYAAQKIWSNQNALDVSQDISQLLVVAKSAGIATKAIASYEEAKKLQKQGYGGGQGQVDALMKSAYQEVLDEIQTLYNFELPEYAPKDSSSSSKSSKDSASDIDWIETKLNNVDKALDKLNSTIDDTYSNWTDRSNALKSAITDTEKAIGLQGQAYTKYMQKAESIKLPEYLKERVRLGDMSIQNDVNSDTKELIDEYSEWYEKAQEAQEAKNELNKSLLELKASDTVDMIEEYYDAIDEAHSNSIESTQNKIDKAETMGFFANGSYYDNIGEELAKQKSNLEKKKADLDKVLANSGLDKNSSSYTELQNLIGSISNEIQQLTIDIEDNKNAAQENEWNYFDYLRESVTRLIEEADFFIELMSNEDLFDDKGNFTKYADATLALHNSNYEVYMANAREYAEEIKALEDDLADGKDVVDRYRELEDAQRDAIKSAQDERKAILDLVEEGYQKQLDYLNEIIDKKKEALNAEKSLYDYQKSIEEKTQTRDSLRRQLNVYKNDNSEEGLAQAQKLSVELQKAEDDLAETEYEKMINDTEQMLDALSSEYEEWMNARLDNEDELLRQIQDKLGENGDINSTLKEISDKYGISMSDSLKTAIIDGKPFDNVVIAINNLIDTITGLVDGEDTKSNSTNTSVGDKSSSADVKQPTTSNNNQPNQPINTQSKSESDNIFIPLKSAYPKDKLDKERSIVDRLKYFDFASDFSSRAIYYKKLGGSGAFTGSDTQNRWLLKRMKEVGYASGTNYAKKGLHWTQEEGDEIIIRKSDGAILTPLNIGDKVVNTDGTNNLYDFANNPQEFLARYGMNYTPSLTLPKIPNIQPRSMSNEVNLGGVHIAQVVTSDAKDFMRQLPSVIANDTKTQKVISEVVLGGALGRNSMSAKRFL